MKKGSRPKHQDTNISFYSGFQHCSLMILTQQVLFVDFYHSGPHWTSRGTTGSWCHVFLTLQEDGCLCLPFEDRETCGSESTGYRARAAWPLEPATGFAFLLKALVPTWQLTASFLFSKPSRPAAWEDTVNKTRLPEDRAEAEQGRAEQRARTYSLSNLVHVSCQNVPHGLHIFRRKPLGSWYPLRPENTIGEKPLFFYLDKEYHEDSMGFALSYPEEIPKFQGRICP